VLHFFLITEKVDPPLFSHTADAFFFSKLVPSTWLANQRGFPRSSLFARLTVSDNCQRPAARWQTWVFAALKYDLVKSKSCLYGSFRVSELIVQGGIGEEGRRAVL